MPSPSESPSIPISQMGPDYRASSSVYQRLFELAPGLFCIAGFDGFFKSLSPMWEKVLGYPKDELLGKPFIEFVHPEDRSATVAEAARLGTSGELTIRFENRYRRQDGTYVWLSWRAAADKDQGLLLAVAEDITAHKLRHEEDASRTRALAEEAASQREDIHKFEMELRGKEEQLISILESMPLGVFVLREDGTPYYANKEASRLLGEPDGNTTLETMKANLLTAVGRPLDVAVGTPLGMTSIGSEINLNGTRRPVDLVIKAIQDRANTSSFLIATIQDLSEKRKLEDQLRHAQKLEGVGRLAAGISHDFNNLLTAILSFAEFATDALSKSDPVYSDVQEIITAAHRAQDLTRQLLAFSRKQTIDPRVLNLATCVDSMFRMLRRLVGDDIEVKVTTRCKDGLVYADPSALEQIVVNLVVNARDAMPEGGMLSLEVDSLRFDEAALVSRGVEIPPGEYLLLSVSDTGCGMDRETQLKVFEPFFTTKGDRGTGLGLSTCYGIVKQAGGNLAVYSEVGLGTTFKVYLPRRYGAEDDLARSSGAPEETEGDETILVAEDNDQVRSLAVRALRTRGYKVLEAANGGEAILLAEAYETVIDLLLTDVVMPRMTGKRLAERIRRMRPGIEVLFMSGYADDVMMHHGVLDNDIVLIQKPFTPLGLAKRVRQFLNQKNASTDKPKTE